MSEKNTWDTIDRRAFMQISAANVAGTVGLAKLGMGGTESHQDALESFSIHVPDAVLDDLRGRLARTRFPNQLEGAAWTYGTELSYLKELCAYWRSEFDWRAQERALNRFDQFRVEIDGLRIHFIHHRSKERNALPLLITHGWPGSVAEFTKIIGPLTNPAAHGASAEDAFHVICPSMPGYGFSDAPRQPGFGIKRVAEACAKLMARLGYTRYGAQGGDWGAAVSAWLAVLDTAHLRGIHLNSAWGMPPEGSPAESRQGLSAEEIKAIERIDEHQKTDLGYAAIQATKPQSLGYGLNDSPAGLAAWIVDKFHSWSDCGGNVEKSFSKDELLTNIMIYWVTQTITSSMRLYYETQGLPEDRIEVPTGCAVLPAQGYYPRSWVEQSFNVKRWTVMPSGGHFAALEEPELLVKDIRAFFRGLR